MFAVPGWDISADALRTQTVSNAPKAVTARKPDHPNGTDRKRSRKRKRGHGLSNALEVTDENLGDLWRRHIEEKSLNRPQQQKVEEGRGNQSDRAGGDALEEIKSVDGGSFKGVSEQNQSARLIEIEVPPKKKKRKRKEHNLDDPILVNGGEDAADTPLPRPKEQREVEDGKSKYEQRKSKALKKREERAILQANGTLPPVRPEIVSSHPTKPSPASPTQPTKPSKSPNAQQEPSTTGARKTPKTIEPSNPSIPPGTTQIPPLPPPSTKLTPLQQRMAAKLTSARFRHLNQTLYTSPSDQAMRLFADSPQNYTSYHAGFRAQVAIWPQNPVECFIQDIKARGAVSTPSQKKLWREQKKGKKSKGSNVDATASTATVAQGWEKPEPLPRPPNGSCTIADLGCGDAMLAGSLSSPSPKSLNLNLKILSFDLAKGDSPHAHLITVADIANLSAAGVKNDSVDVAICCLSLMGTNWVDVVDECKRILRRGGEVWVAEIKSRFARAGDKEKKKKEKAGGGGTGNKKGKDAIDEDEGDEEAMALEEIEDGKARSGTDETDVDAFVAVFRKRGLVLKGEPDMANKMFVRMRFVKSLVVGGGKVEKDGDGGGKGAVGKGKMHAKKKTTRFLEDDDYVDGEEVDENKVLKPCVYKTR